MFENLRIRTKIVVILAAPVIALLLVSGAGAVQRRASASNSKTDEQLITAAQADTNTAYHFGLEGFLSAQIAAGGTEARAALDAQRKATDQSVLELKQQLEELGGSAGNETQSAIATTSRRLATLTTIRQVIDNNKGTPAAMTTAYPDAAEELLTLQTTLIGEAHDPQVASQMQSLYALARYNAAVAKSNTLLAPAVAAHRFADAAATQAFYVAANEESVRGAVFDTSATPAAKALLRSADSGPAVQLADDVHDGALTSADVAPGVDLNTWSKAVQTKLGKIHGVGTQISAGLLAQAKQATTNATKSANLFLLAALLAVAIAIGLAWALARAITRPLARLTTAAQSLATEQLPHLVKGLKNPAAEDVSFLTDGVTKIDVTSHDELGQLAEAFNAVQQVAVDVASEQAELLRKGIGDMFVNLARRNQALLDRQIEFIDELENNEEDPDQLEHLFHLDHLATRMRRNAESLLVLAGAEPNRRRGRPVALTDVVRAALGEVEDFGRIDLLELEDVLVTNNAAADVAHLLSELMENATNFSPPDTRVEVVGHRTNADGYVLSVTDTGIGMTPDQMAEANETLAHPPLVGLAMSRSLGFIVIGRLAARFGISVRLMSSPAGGVTAVVAMPAVIIHELPNDAPIDLEPSAPVVEGHSEGWTPQLVTTGSALLPPLEFTPFGSDEEPPGSFEEAVPGGAAFEQGVAGLVDEDAIEPIVFDSGAAHDAQDDAQDEADEAAGPAAALPSLAPSTPPAPGAPRPADDEPVHLFGPGPTPEAPPAPTPPPAALAPGLPSRGAPAPVANGTELPTDDGAPSAGIRLFGSVAPPPAAPPAPPAPPAEAPAAPESLPGQAVPSADLFGGPEPAGANGSGPEPLPVPAPSNRLFGSPAPPPTTNGNGHANGNGNGSAPEGTVDAAPAAPAGLARRTPRKTSAGGTNRPVPGSDGPSRQGVVATKRSPDEVRSLLSNYRSGSSKAKAAPVQPTEPPTPEGDS